MSIFEKCCSSHVFIFLSIAQTGLGLTILLLGNVTAPFVMQTSSFVVLYSVSLGNEIINLHEFSLKYIFSLVVILPATIISETLCIHSISNITSRIQLEMMKDPYPGLKSAEYYENTKLAISINGAILYIVNGMPLTYLWLGMIDMYQFSNRK